MASINITLIFWVVTGVVVAYVIIKNFDKIKKFISEATVELKKVAWTTRQELIDATWIVLVSSAIMGIYISIVDFALSKCVSLFIR